MIGAGKAQQLVNGGLVLIVLGGNDFVNNYFLVPYSARRLQYPIPEFCQYLVSEYKKILLVTKLAFPSFLDRSMHITIVPETVRCMCIKRSRTQ